MNRQTNNNILVPTDFSEISKNALSHALKIADVYNNEITLLYILDDGGLIGSLFMSDEKVELMKSAIHTKLDELIISSNTEFPNVKINKRIESGKIYKTIAETANEENFDSIVMGTNGADGIQKIVGSNASRVMNSSEVPVVVVNENKIKKSGYETIVLPMDTSRESRQKISWGIHLAKKFNSTIHVIYENATNSEERARIFAVINQTQDLLDKGGVNYIVRGLDDEKYPDNFAEDTINYAEEVDADLVIIMSQQDKSLGEIFGSYAQKIVTDAGKVPIMCIRSTDKGINIESSTFG